MMSRVLLHCKALQTWSRMLMMCCINTVSTKKTMNNNMRRQIRSRWKERCRGNIHGVCLIQYFLFVPETSLPCLRYLKETVGMVVSGHCAVVPVDQSYRIVTELDVASCQLACDTSLDLRGTTLEMVQQIKAWLVEEERRMTPGRIANVNTCHISH